MSDLYVNKINVGGLDVEIEDVSEVTKDSFETILHQFESDINGICDKVIENNSRYFIETLWESPYYTEDQSGVKIYSPIWTIDVIINNIEKYELLEIIYKCTTMDSFFPSSFQSKIKDGYDEYSSILDVKKLLSAGRENLMGFSSGDNVQGLFYRTVSIARRTSEECMMHITEGVYEDLTNIKEDMMISVMDNHVLIPIKILGYGGL